MEWISRIMLTQEMEHQIAITGNDNFIIRELIKRMVNHIISTSQIELTRESDPFTYTSIITLKFKSNNQHIN